MVYRGPSQGCQVCRERRIKCDGGLPACRNCIKRGRICPGPKDDFDMVLRDKSASTAEHVRKRIALAHSKKSRTSTEPSSDDADEARDSQTQDLHFEANQDTLVSQKMAKARPVIELNLVPQDVEQESLCFLFSNYASRGVNQKGAGFVEHLFPLYFEASPDSPLSLATLAVATNVLSQRKFLRTDTYISRSFYAKCVVEAQTALLDPHRSCSDHLLATVLMLNFYDILNAQFTCSVPCRHHLQGAVALVNHRGAKNFATDLSRRLFMAVQMSVLPKAMASNSHDQNSRAESIWAIDSEEPSHVEMEMNKLAVQFANINSTAEKVIRNVDAEGAEMHINLLWHEAAQLDSQLKDWYHNLPAAWTPEIIPMAVPVTSNDGTRELFCEVYPELNKIATVNKYRRLRIVTLQIMGKCNYALSRIARQAVIPDAYITAEIKDLRKYTLHSLIS